MAPASFETISAELGLMILEQLASPKDVYSTIRASALYYGIFRANKSLILAATIKRAISPQALAEAIAACNASQNATLATPIIDDKGAMAHAPTSENMQRRVEAFLADTNTDKPGPNLRDLSVSVPLCRLWALTEFFIADYSGRALAKMQTSTVKERMPRSHDGSVPRLGYMRSLSESERGRLQWAFFRFEAYRKLFGGLNQTVSRTDRLSGVTAEHLLFMKNFRLWELEELNAIYEYLVRLVEEVFDDLEQEIFTEMQKAAKNDEATSEEYANIRELDLVGLEMFLERQKYSQADQIAFLVELGLPFLKRLLEMSKSDRMAIVTSFDWSTRKPSLGDVIQDVWYDLGRDVRAHVPPRGEHLNAPNAFWLFSMYYHISKEDYGLRELGYIFWDTDRLEEAGVAGVPREDLGPILNLRNRREELSVEEKLGDIKITHKTLDGLRPKEWDPEERREWLESLEY